MRIDKFLKVSRLIKRRTVAAEACEQGRVFINEKVVKPSAEVRPGDSLLIRFGEKQLRVRVKAVMEHVPKGDVSELYELLP